MLKKRGKLAYGLSLIRNAVPSALGSLRGMWASGNRTLVPLVIFLVLTGLVLVFAASIEALAPFIYTIF